jgi:hypothetical protein
MVTIERAYQRCVLLEIISEVACYIKKVEERGHLTRYPQYLAYRKSSITIQK